MDGTGSRLLPWGLLGCGLLLPLSRWIGSGCKSTTVLRPRFDSQKCEAVAPSGPDLVHLAASTMGSTSIALLPSAGKEEEIEGFRRGHCVTGVLTGKETVTRHACLRMCSDDDRCLGVLWGQVQTPAGYDFHCFLAGAGDGPTIMEYPCDSTAMHCPLNTSYKALADLAPTFSCWQRLWWQCPSPRSQAMTSILDMFRRARSSCIGVVHKYQADSSVMFQYLLKRAAEMRQFALASASRVAEHFDGVTVLLVVGTIFFTLAMRYRDASAAKRAQASMTGAGHVAPSSPIRLRRRVAPPSATPQRSFIIDPARSSESEMSDTQTEADSNTEAEAQTSTQRMPLQSLNHLFDKARSLNQLFDQSFMPCKPAKQLSQAELLHILNTCSISDIESLEHVGEKSARKILRYRDQHKGELTCMSELVTKVGLQRCSVTKFMRSYGICD